MMAMAVEGLAPDWSPKVTDRQLRGPENQTDYRIHFQAADGDEHKLTFHSPQSLQLLEDMIDLTSGLPTRDVLMLSPSTLHFFMSSAFHHQTNVWA